MTLEYKITLLFINILWTVLEMWCTHNKHIFQRAVFQSIFIIKDPSLKSKPGICFFNWIVCLLGVRERGTPKWETDKKESFTNFRKEVK